MKGIQATPVKVFSCYKDIPSQISPIVLTIGNFDAVHSGHQEVLNQAKMIAQNINGYVCVLTFLSHPVEVLRPGIIVPKLCTSEQKLKLLEKQDVDLVIFFEFTLPFSQQTAAEFLKNLHHYIPFKSLVLGHDAQIGSDRLGDSHKMHQIANQLGFVVTYVQPHQVEGTIVSSSVIRQALQRGDLNNAEKMLGRKFSIFATIASVVQRKLILANHSMICLPPEGVYPVKVMGNSIEAFAKVEIKKQAPYLELEFTDDHLFASGQNLEIIFL